MSYFIKEGAKTYNYLTLNEEYFAQGYAPTFYVICPECDFTSKETQFEMIAFFDNLMRCDGCSEDWFKANAMSCWYTSFNAWVRTRECYEMRGGIKPFDKVVDPEFFTECLDQYLNTDIGRAMKQDMLFSEEVGHPDRKITGFKFIIQTELIED